MFQSLDLFLFLNLSYEFLAVFNLTPRAGNMTKRLNCKLKNPQFKLCPCRELTRLP